MSRRITVVLEDELVKKLRNRQAKEFLKSKNVVSFSQIINNIVRENLKKAKH